ncbi:lysosome membrane protein 2c [Thalassophryne amazonica]|uniref:lysosome membrane protein 2c n=1 Tax=Thalassophryne amazonica TaxID=390379 RepID=UPI0014725601|nr:lysosome membrane protein 2c [Thalassophryne amazonica]
MQWKSCCVYSIGVFSVVILIVGISLITTGVFPHLMYSVIEKNVVLKNGTEVFKAWEDPPSPVYMQFYFFNVTNPMEVLEGERPAVLQVGPYTYREYRPMEQVEFLDNGTKVAAINRKTYIFQPDMSYGPESDVIRTVNIPAMTVMEKFKDMSAVAEMISAYMRSTGEGLFTSRTVRELLWGYEDGLLKTLKLFIPELDDVFGLFYKSNASDDGQYVFFTGQQNYKDFAQVDTWNGESSLNWWTTDECNMINGTNGAFFHSVINKNETLYMFISDMCRSLYTLYEEDVTVKGIPGYRFTPPSKVFANLTVNPDNAGFCVPAGNCMGSGLLNVSVCKQGAPIVMSSPHFYQADDKFVEDVFGMQPDKEQHQTTVDINPLTGILLQAAKRLQINIYVQQVPRFSQTGKVRTVVFPVVYLNESTVIDDASAVKLQAIVSKQNVVENIPFIFIGLGVLLGAIFMIMMCQQKVPESTTAEREPLLSSKHQTAD